MIEAKVARPSFAAGEVSPQLYNRDDLARQQVGAKRVENLFVLVEGGLQRIPGTRFVDTLKTQSQKGLFVPFRFDDANSYNLIFNDSKMRVKKDGGIVLSAGNPYELTIPYAEADLENVRWAQDRDVMFLACAGQAPRELTRVAHDNWTIANHQPAGGPVKDQNTDEAKTIQASAKSGSIALTASTSLFQSGHVGGTWRLDEPDRLAQELWKANEVINSESTALNTTSLTKIGNMTSTAGSHAIGNAFNGVYATNFADALAANQAGLLSAWIGVDCGVSTPQAISKVQLWGAADAGFVTHGSQTVLNNQSITIELWAKTSGTAPANELDGEMMGSVTFNDAAGSFQTIYSKDTTTLRRYWWIRIRLSVQTAMGFYVAEMMLYTFSTSRIAPKRRYNGNTYEALTDGDAGTNPPTHDEGDVAAGSGNVVWRFLHKGYGYVRITAVASGTSATATVLQELPEGVVTKATSRWSASAWDDVEGWPSLVCLHQRRMWWFRTDRFWASRSSDVFDHDVELSATGVATDDSPLSGRILSPDGSVISIEFALASGQLVLGMQDGEWLLRPGTNATAAVTPTNINPLNDTTEGSAKHVPAQVEGGALFIGKSRKRLHMARFDRLTDRIETEEVTMSARHILRGLARRVVFQRDPHKLAWVQCLDGTLICVTFMPKEKVLGFARRLFVNGIVEDICVTPKADGTVDVLDLIVRRTIGGQTRRYVEELAPFFEPLSDAAPTAAGAWFVDSGLRYQGAPATVISGFLHLAGEEIAVFADGAMQARKTVNEAGQITLDRSASDVIGGIPQTWRLIPLSFDPPKQEGSSKGDFKQMSSVLLELVLAAGGMSKGRADADPEPIFVTGDLPAAAPLPLTTGRVEVKCESVSEFETYLELYGDDALPFGISGIVPNISVASK